MESMRLYDHPEYCEMAFSFRNIPQEANFFDECIKRHSRIPVRRVLELGAGTAPHLEEWAKRKIDYTGIDTNMNMLRYARKKAAKLPVEARFIRADMRAFSLDAKVDFAYIMLGSLYAQTTEDLGSHFDSVAHALRPGGLYFLDWCVNFEWAGRSGSEQSWKIKKGPVKVEATFRMQPMDRAAQTVRNTLTISVEHSGKVRTLRSNDVVRTVFPQEFILLAERARRFEFLGWWNNWNLDEPISTATRIRRPIVLLRKRKSARN